MVQIAFGGSCYWCMEAIYQSLIGIQKVEQGFIASKLAPENFSEAVIAHFNPEEISLEVLIKIHLHTHKSTVNHSRRDLYKSAVYVFSEKQHMEAAEILKALQEDFTKEIVTKVFDFKTFKVSDEMFHNYYYSDTEKPFCKSYINPKLKKLLTDFSAYTKKDKLNHIE